ncbi:carboxyl-terminal-processing peptidase 1, chloroplastic isoform X1 [Typha latifolia]|uniref:carboxyl-terminal-processing peptidase 1, chloroplastic isoform X1 n=1 Tax=Typha latifolia TaxID=4733 RepID=UPI003C2AAE9B
MPPVSCCFHSSLVFSFPPRHQSHHRPKTLSSSLLNLTTNYSKPQAIKRLPGTHPCLQNLLFRALAGALSFSLLFSAPVPFASASEEPIHSPPSELCSEEAAGAEEAAATPVGESPHPVTNEELVEEAWEVVYESFLPDAGRRPWSPEMWMQKKQDILQRKIQTRSKAHEIIRKMLASLGDPYTRFLPPAEFSKMAKYDVTGIGVNLREVPDDNGSIKLKVLGIILDGPAHSAGVRQGDELLSVNGIDVRGKSAFDVSSLLQGPKETFVTIEVKHGDCGPVQSIKVERQVVARTPVFYRLEKMENGDSSAGYIHIKEFNALAKKDLVTALRRLQSSGASYFILDLRDNLGGLVQAGIEVSKLFLTKGETIIYTVGRDRQVQNSIVAETGPLVTTPLIILVNNRTASASEIVASALHDNCKAVLVGEKTFGKGLIQSVFELHDGSGVVVTIGKYVTPSHRDINGNGIEPDFLRLPALNEVTHYFSRCQFRGVG